MYSTEKDLAMREALFQHVDRLVAEHGATVPAVALRSRFIFDEFSFTPLQQAGIFRPRPLQADDAAVVLVSSVDGPYEDAHDVNSGFLRYKYQGKKGDEDNWYNSSLRAALTLRRPLLYLCGTGNNQYLPLYPCYVIEDHRDAMYVDVAVSDRSIIVPSSDGDAIQSAMRAYATVLAKRRIHQTAFRSIVMKAYRTTCAVCQLKIDRLLDAAHIIPDNEPDGVPVVDNGISLCKIHHQAYDWNIIGISPDYLIHVSQETLEAVDGPMLTHGIQGLHHQKIILPRRESERPSAERLERRFSRFLNE